MKLITVDDRLLMEYHFDKVRSSFNPKSTDDFNMDLYLKEHYWRISDSISDFCELIEGFLRIDL